MRLRIEMHTIVSSWLPNLGTDLACPIHLLAMAACNSNNSIEYIIIRIELSFGKQFITFDAKDGRRRPTASSSKVGHDRKWWQEQQWCSIEQQCCSIEQQCCSCVCDRTAVMFMGRAAVMCNPWSSIKNNSAATNAMCMHCTAAIKLYGGQPCRAHTLHLSLMKKGRDVSKSPINASNLGKFYLVQRKECLI